MVGSVKVTQWNKSIVLPIQKLFNFYPEVLEQNGVRSIWHIGRFAIAKSEKEGAKLLRRLITMAIYPICAEPDSIMLAECDSKFVKVLNLMGIKTGLLAPGIHYLGSETLPIYSTNEWLSAFLNRSPYYEEAVGFYKQCELSQKWVKYNDKSLVEGLKEYPVG